MDFNLKNYKKIFFIGIGGISMSALAKIFHCWGYCVSGSDLAKNKETKKLKKLGIKVYNKHKKTNVKGFNLVVFSGAIKSDNPEYVYAKQNNIKIIERSELLFLVSKQFKNVIAVSGTHGKTTTTALIGYIFLVAGLKPTIHIGAEFSCIGGNLLMGENNFFITEACEFRNSFLTLKPNVSVITNIEKEHLDFFQNFENVKNSFNVFKENTIGECFISYKYKKLIKSQTNLTTYGGNNNADICAKNIVLEQDHKYKFDCVINRKTIGSFKLNIYGKHNIENALSAIAVSLKYGISYNVIKLALKNFNNASRRFEFLGEYNGNIVIHDYAHHPTEIATTIKTCAEVFNKKIVCIFEPHTYSRTKTLIKNFMKCFNGVNYLYLVKTYSARESYDYFGSAEFLKKMLETTSPSYKINGIFSERKTLKKIKKEGFANNIILFLGAGSIENLANKLVKT